MLKLEAHLHQLNLTNVHVSRTQFSPIWGANSLLKMILFCIQDAIENVKWNDWDFVQNLSETDFTMATLEEHEAVLNA